MAKNQTRQVASKVLDQDYAALIALQEMTGYAPANTDYSLTALQALYATLEEARADEINAQNAVATVRDAKVAAQWAFHNGILGAKDQVRAQFGLDSDELQSLGLKKKSEYK